MKKSKTFHAPHSLSSQIILDFGSPLLANSPIQANATWKK